MKDKKKFGSLLKKFMLHNPKKDDFQTNLTYDACKNFFVPLKKTNLKTK